MNSFLFLVFLPLKHFKCSGSAALLSRDTWPIGIPCGPEWCFPFRSSANVFWAHFRDWPIWWSRCVPLHSPSSETSVRMAIELSGTCYRNVESILSWPVISGAEFSRDTMRISSTFGTEAATTSELEMLMGQRLRKRIWWLRSQKSEISEIRLCIWYIV